MTQTVYLSLGSNIDREDNITGGLNALQKHFGSLSISPIYESKAVGFEGDNFFNLIVGIQCDLTLLNLLALLKSIEDQYGRLRHGEKFAPRTLDIDIVLYGNLLGMHSNIELPRPELYYNAFVLRPLSDLAPNLVDPKSGACFKDLWLAFETEQQLWQIDWTWS